MGRVFVFSSIFDVESIAHIFKDIGQVIGIEKLKTLYTGEKTLVSKNYIDTLCPQIYHSIHP